MTENLDLHKMAKNTLRPRKLARNGKAGYVASALLTENDNVFTGVAIDVACSIGFCAEHSAIAAMVTAGETRIKEIIAVHRDGRVLPPCGRCREFIVQINNRNYECNVHVSGDRIVPLSALLPERWDI
ncbi:cytidine deaminase [Jeotgalicoccus nanhaiensis]|jgi:Cytidine deaminase|uniref:Cytidine deaminase n=1 Tax=Jeotgalicoccus nanhaiensis TaxID=568603 RepID=A0ABR9XYK2_9STAP|nr:cytidine deaminase [Jeotgalicoccus nanhaiensis]MBF0754066.1 cytidine deaminase [Jeotgalicoccus nanhaiensis]TFU61551.1 cytidine deaminase [Jeotgalicoccus nanhaiensis]